MKRTRLQQFGLFPEKKARDGGNVKPANPEALAPAASSVRGRPTVTVSGSEHGARDDPHSRPPKVLQAWGMKLKRWHVGRTYFYERTWKRGLSVRFVCQATSGRSWFGEIFTAPGHPTRVHLHVGPEKTFKGCRRRLEEYRRNVRTILGGLSNG